jgi:hypothetical protein
MNPKRMKIWLVILQLAALVPPVCATEQNYSLILAEYGKDASGEQTQTLVRYHFQQGVMVKKESVLTTKTSDLRYDLGGNWIYDDKYVVTRWDDVVDLTTGKRLHQIPATLAASSKNSNRDVDQEPRGVSPNGQLTVNGNFGEIWLNRPNGSRTLLGSDFFREGTVYCNSLLKPSFLWFDDRHILTQRGNGHLVIVDLQGKSEPLVNIPNVEAPACGPDLERDDEGHIYYREREKAWLINVVERTFEPYVWESKGNGFDLEYQRDPAYGNAIRYEGVEIGRWWCGSAVTGPRRIALEYGAVGSNLGYPEGVKVWSEESGQWSTIKPEWLTAIIGWVRD